MREFDSSNTAFDVVADLDLNGKKILITGASGGLGAQAATVLAGRGAAVVIAARDDAKSAQLRTDILAIHPNADVFYVKLELDNLASVRAAAKAVLADHPILDVVIANAGVMACDYQQTSDGFEYQFGVNHIGHFLFTCLLIPTLQQANAGRVVVLTSAGHKFGAVDLEDYNFDNQPYQKWLSYGRSKTANALFAIGLNQRIKTLGITANAVHPGMIATELGRHLTKEDIEQLSGMTADIGADYKSVEQGAATEVWAATAPELEGKGGLYLEDNQVGEQATENATGGYMPFAVDIEIANQLWQLTEQLLGESFSWR
jgi:NAD(P)-dependent dehydrogenase (short-subunit alcohol dehydrogenase family)